MARDYSLLENRWKRLNIPECSLESLASIHGYPFYRILIGKNAPRNVLITAGIHGDEPSGPEAILRFLERGNWNLRFNFTVFPCLNPTGYVQNTRENLEGKDINRTFGGDDVKEANLVKRLLQGMRFDVYVDLHEDYDASGFYIYEGKKDKNWMGHRIIQKVRKLGAIDEETDEIDIPIGPGHLQADPGWDNRGIVSYAYTHHSDHVLIFETPSTHPMDERISMHLTALEAVLDFHQQDKGNSK